MEVAALMAALEADNAILRDGVASAERRAERAETEIVCKRGTRRS